MTKCMLDALEGCDEATLESVLGEGTSLESLETAHQACAGNADDECDISAVFECPKLPTPENSQTLTVLCR